MRVGVNPSKSIAGARVTAPVTVALLVYIPFEGGYFREGLDVLKLCLQSVYSNTTLPYDLFVFDNGSAKSVADFLVNEQREGRIQYLALAGTNIGKAAALNFICGSAPGEFIAYSDADAFFFPGWLEAHTNILKTFPKVGIVNGLPAPHLTSWATDSTLSIAKTEPGFQMEAGHLIPKEIISSLCEGVGRSLDDYLRENEKVEAIKLTYKGVEAYVGAHHFQFVARKSVLQEVGPFPTTALLSQKDDRQFDLALDKAGYMRLATASQYVFHLGNVLTPKWRQVAQEYSVAIKMSARKTSSRPVEKLKGHMRENPLVKRVLLKLYGGIFNLIYGKPAIRD